MHDTVIIPTYNEALNISPLVEAIFKILPDIYICVVDDNSSDGTGEIVNKLTSDYPHLSVIHRKEKKGLGPAYVHAFRQAIQDPSISHVIMMDADFSHDPKYLPDILKASHNYDLVIGSRYVSGGGVRRWGIERRILSRGANFYIRAILHKKIQDWTGGFNCITTDLLRRVDLSRPHLSGYAFISELKYRLISMGASVCEVPIIFEERIYGASKISSGIIWEGVMGPWDILFSSKSLPSLKNVLRRMVAKVSGLVPERTLEFVYTTLCKPSFIRRPVNHLLSLMIPETVTIQGVNVALNRNDPVVSGALMLDGFERFESSLFFQKMRLGMTVIDIGANVGLYTALASQGVGVEGRVFSFEPDPENYSFLQKTVSLNGASNVECLNMAISDTPGSLTLFFSEQHRGDHRTYNPGDKRTEIKVEAVSVDDFVKNYHIQKVDFIKMDIQGAEALALKGMEETLRKFKPQIFTEFWPEGIKLCGGNSLDFLEKLVGLGYHIWEINMDKKQIIPVSDFQNFIESYSGRKFTNLYCEPLL